LILAFASLTLLAPVGCRQPARSDFLDPPDNVEVVPDQLTGLLWQRNIQAGAYTWTGADAYCDGLELARHDDWRLPTRMELVSILDLTRSHPAIDVRAFPDAPSEWFWTSSRSAVGPSRAWYVYFYFGYVGHDDTTNVYRVRCVRGQSPEHQPRYEIQAETVRDLVTGLTWQRTAAPDSFTFSQSEPHCAALDLGAGSDWRPPTMKELETLVDESRSDPALDIMAFPDQAGGPFWTSSSWAGTSSLAWYVDLDDGSALYDRVTSPFRVRCVR
jgi:hypothetical protein